MTVHVIDVHVPGDPGGHTGAFLVVGDDPVLIDCGPAAAFASLEAGIRDAGVAVAEIRHLLLTHIHLDHAGAAGLLAARAPGLDVHVHALGARHLVDPTRLMASARRVFGDDLDRLFGELEPVPNDRLHVVEEASTIDVAGGIEAFPTPGHARHHLAFAFGDGTVFSGDVAGSNYLGARYLIPDAPPPDIDLPAWDASLVAIVTRQPRRLAVSHFGIVDDPVPLLDAFAERVHEWAAWAADGRETFLARAMAEVGRAMPAATLDRYLDAEILEHSYDGFARYHETQA